MVVLSDNSAVDSVSALLAEAAQHPWLQDQDLELDEIPPASLVVHVEGKFRGTWRWDGSAYGWIPAGYRLPQVRLASAIDSVRFMADTLFPNVHPFQDEIVGADDEFAAQSLPHCANDR